MNIREIDAKKILTVQKSGFLTQGPYPYTHTLSWSAGCGFGHSYCGAYCYAQHFPNWLYNKTDDEQWGDAIIVKRNAPELLRRELQKAYRPNIRIYMSPVTDVYQPLERKLRMTRRLLQVFADFPDLDLLVVQTRGPLVQDDIPLLQQIPYVVVSMSIETDRADLAYGPSAAQLKGRFAAMTALTAAGIDTQVTVSPCLPYSPAFADKLIATGVRRIVVDTFKDGDGSRGARTADSPFAARADYDWRNDDPAHALYDQLAAQGITVGWSVQGFGMLPFRAERLAARTD